MKLKDTRDFKFNMPKYEKMEKRGFIAAMTGFIMTLVGLVITVVGTEANQAGLTGKNLCNTLKDTEVPDDWDETHIIGDEDEEED